MRLCIVTPIYNDWDCFRYLLEDIDKLKLDHIHVLGVNDGSYELPPTSYPKLQHIARIEILHLVRNLGHQRAIAVGLVEIFKNTEADCVVIMDSDGEDQPTEIP